MGTESKTLIRERRQNRIRKKITGTAERPRLAVFTSGKHIYAQLIDDTKGATLAAASTLDKELKGQGDTVASAKKVGASVAARAKAKKIETVVFDRGGFRYHGKVKALADAAREAGLKF